MIQLPLLFRESHLFIEFADELWLLDTGAPTSFGTQPTLSLAGAEFPLQKNYLGLTAATLSRFVSVDCAGLLGADVLGAFDLIFDIPNATLVVSTDELEFNGQAVALDEFMGIPILTARIRGANHRMFFDTGAQICYWQDDSLTKFPFAGEVSDFYPGVGQFQTDTYRVDLTLGKDVFTVRCGTLPGLLGMTLMMADTTGIVGNEILSNRAVGYFPRRMKLIL